MVTLVDLHFACYFHCMEVFESVLEKRTLWHSEDPEHRPYISVNFHLVHHNQSSIHFLDFLEHSRSQLAWLLRLADHWTGFLCRRSHLCSPVPTIPEPDDGHDFEISRWWRFLTEVRLPGSKCLPFGPNYLICRTNGRVDWAVNSKQQYKQRPREYCLSLNLTILLLNHAGIVDREHLVRYFCKICTGSN